MRRRARRCGTTQAERRLSPETRRHGPGLAWGCEPERCCASGQSDRRQRARLQGDHEFTRERLAIDVAGSISSRRVIDVLARLISTHGAPMFPRSDHGPESLSRAILERIAGRRRHSADQSSRALAGRTPSRKAKRALRRRVPERPGVPHAVRSARRHRALAARPQCGSAAQLPGPLDPAREQAAASGRPQPGRI